MNAPTADSRQMEGSPEIFVQSAIKHIGNVGSVDLSSLGLCCQRNVLHVKKNVSFSISLVTRRSAAVLAMLILA